MIYASSGLGFIQSEDKEPVLFYPDLQKIFTKMRVRRIRSRSLLCMIVLTLALLALNFILVEQHREYKAKNQNQVNETTTVTPRAADEEVITEILSNATINVIMAYMRTGSSFAGVTLQEYPGTFYLYEPIRSIWEKFYYEGKAETPVLYPNGTVITHKLEDKDKVIMKEVIDYITCDFGNLSVMSLLDKFHRSKTKLMKRLRWCTEVHENTTNENAPLLGFEKWTKCFQEVKETCETSKVRLLKFIRLPLASMRRIIPAFPNMKILHLHRDPRAIFNSRAQLNDTPQTATDQEVADHCNQWFEDIQLAREVAKEYPGRFKTVRYEDITEHPPEAFKAICDYFKIEYEPEIQTYLTKATTAAADSGPWDFERANPYETAMKWRQQMNFTKAEVICRICDKPMKELNYYSFKSAEEMANSELPVRGPLPDGPGAQSNVTAV